MHNTIGGVWDPVGLELPTLGHSWSSIDSSVSIGRFLCVYINALLFYSNLHRFLSTSDIEFEFLNEFSHVPMDAMYRTLLLTFYQQ